MTDIIEEARAMLAKVAQHMWIVETYGCVGGPHGCVVDPDGGTVAETWSAEDAALIAAAPRLLAALADECERLRAENARLREKMPTEEEIDAIRDGIYADDRMTRSQLDDALKALSKVSDVRELVDAASAKEVR